LLFQLRTRPFQCPRPPPRRASAMGLRRSTLLWYAAKIKWAASGSFGLLFAALRVAAMARSTTARLRSYSTWRPGLMPLLLDLMFESSRAMVCRYERSPGSSFTGVGLGAEFDTGFDGR